MDIETIGGHAGSTFLGGVVAWLTLKGKVEKMEALSREFKHTTETAILEIKAAMGKVVYLDRCEICEKSNDQQFKQLNEKVDTILHNLSRRRDDEGK